MLALAVFPSFVATESCRIIFFCQRAFFNSQRRADEESTLMERGEGGGQRVDGGGGQKDLETHIRTDQGNDDERGEN